MPSEIPWDEGIPMWPYLRILNPVMAPKMPTNTTIVAVRDGMPPMLCVTSIAIGVVTDFAASESTTMRDAPKYCARATTDTMPTRHPTSCDMNIGTISCFMEWSCLYSGTPSDTTAGLSQKSIFEPLNL